MLRGGLLDVVDAGIYTKLTTGGNYAAFSASGAIIGDNIARIAAQLANVDATNVVVCVNPTDFLSVQLAKADTAGTYLGLPPSLTAATDTTRAVASAKLHAFAPGSGANWAEREGVGVQVGLCNDQFTRNALTVRCENRGIAFVRDPAQVAYDSTIA